MKLGGIYISVGAKTKKLKRDLAKAEGMTKKTAVLMKQEIGRISFAQVGIATAAFALGIAALGKKVITLGREFESTMKTVQAWSGATGRDLKNLTDIARTMGATTEHTATQAAGALKFLAAAGFSAKNSIAALPGTLNLATAGQVALAEATDITTDVLTAFGLQVEELSRVNDAFITTSSSSNTNVLMLGQSMKMVAPTAKLFGLTVEQTAAFLGTLANAGVKAEMAGSGLNMVLLKSARAAKKLGLEAGTPLIEVLKKMKEAQWGAVQIGEAFGARQVKTAAILMDGIKNYEKLTQKILDNVGATSKLADVIRDSLDVDLKTLNSTIEEELLRTFDKYKDYMREVVQSTTEWIRQNPQAIEQVAELSKNMFELVVAMGKVIKLGVEYVNVWVKSAQAMGLASAGIITWRTALTDGATAVDQFNKGLSTEELRLLELEKIMARTKDWAGVYTEKAYQNAKQEAEILREIIASRKALAALKAPGRLEEALANADKYYGVLINVEKQLNKVDDAIYEQTEKMKARYVKYYEALEEMEDHAHIEEINRERERLRELENYHADRLSIWESYYEALEEMEDHAYIEEINRERERLRELENYHADRLSIWESYNEDWQILIKSETQFKLDEYAKDLDAYLILEQAKTGMTDAQIKIRKQLMLNAYEDSLRKEKEILNEVQEYWEHTFENIHDATADTFYDIFKNAEDGFRGLIENIKNWFLRLLAEMAAMALANPIKIIIGTIGGALGLPGIANAGGLGGAASGIAKWINQSPFGGTGLLNQWGTTWGNMLSYAGIAFNTINAINALSKGNYGTAAGTGIGTIGGALLGGPIGAAIGGGIGSFIGGIIDSIFGGSNAGFGSSGFLSGSGVGKWGDLPSFGDWSQAAGAGGPASTELLEGFEKSIHDTLQGIYDAIDGFSERMPDEIRKKFEAALADIEIAILPHLAGMTDEINEQFYFVLTRENVENLEEYIKSIPAFILDQIAPALQDAISEWAGTFDLTLLKEDSPLQKLYDEILEGVQDGDWETYLEKVDAFMNTMGAVEEVWAALNKTIDSVLNPMNAFDAALFNLNAQFDQWIDTLEQLGFTEEALAEIEAKRLLIIHKMIDDLVIEAQRTLLGTTEIGVLKDIAKRYGLVFSGMTEEWAQSIIDGFTSMSTDEVIAMAESLGVSIATLVNDILFLSNHFDLLSNKLKKIGKDIRAMLSNISGSFGPPGTAAGLMTQITDLQSIPMAKQTGANLLSMSEKLIQWYQAAVAEEQERVRLLNEENRLLERVVEHIENLVDQIDQVIKNIKYSALNISLPYQKAAEAEKDYWELYSAAKTGGTEDIQKYIGFVQTYLQQMQAEHKSSQAYQDIYAMVMGEGGHLREIQGMLEAGNYDQKIYDELKDTHNDIKVDLTKIQATFSEFEGWILNALKTLEGINIILTINWGEFEGTVAEVMEMLLELVSVYGWNNVIVLEWISNMAAWAAQDIEKAMQLMEQIAEKSGGWDTVVTLTFIASIAQNLLTFTDAMKVLEYIAGAAGWDSIATITFISNIPIGLFADLNAVAVAAGWIASISGGWNTTATITFLKNIAANWEFENIDQILAAIGWVKQQAGSWTADATISFIATLMDRYGATIDHIDYWLDQMGIKDIALRRKMEILLIYSLAVSGNINEQEIADWAFVKAVEANLADNFADSVAALEQLRDLAKMFKGCTSPGVLGEWMAVTSSYAIGNYTAVQGAQIMTDLYNKFGVKWARGGIVNEPTYGVVGEAGYPEAVIPMMDGYSIPVKWTNGGSNQKTERPVDINLTIELDGKPLDIKIKSISSREADNIRVQANKTKGNETRRLYR